MDLNILWFVLIAILYTGFFVLEGFDFGVGMLLPFMSKNDLERRAVINTIGPHWDANEVWLLTAGGATFAAFPHWYATMFSGFYVPLFLLLVGLILRGVAIEFRSKDKNPKWRALWDWAISLGSFLGSIGSPSCLARLCLSHGHLCSTWVFSGANQRARLDRGRSTRSLGLPAGQLAPFMAHPRRHPGRPDP